MFSGTWALDNASRITSATSPNGPTSYTHDATNQLTAADHSFTADEN